MSQPYIGEIRLFGGNFAPAGWAYCNGQLMPISENDTLFNLIGTTYGGDGQETFALPDLQGRIPMHQGTRPGGSTYRLSDKGGVETITLSPEQIPPHSHTPMASAALASSTSAAGVVSASWPDAPYNKVGGAVTAFPLAPEAVGGTGGGQPHENMPPFLGLSFIISLFGIFPSQS
ncbi:phage tail protein [Leifsonia sp. YAF41]|uniref:phage tail protein n=1 Tax=Leifsonia sp. YAF41 TaxID=3233086 RepID=UPI003F9C1837